MLCGATNVSYSSGRAKATFESSAYAKGARALRIRASTEVAAWGVARIGLRSSSAISGRATSRREAPAKVVASAPPRRLVGQAQAHPARLRLVHQANAGDLGDHRIAEPGDRRGGVLLAGAERLRHDLDAEGPQQLGRGGGADDPGAEGGQARRPLRRRRRRSAAGTGLALPPGVAEP